MAEKTYAIPAQGAGYFQLMGQIRAVGALRLDVPEGVLNIGGNGKGYVLEARTDWDPTEQENQDGSLDSISLGDDIYLYAVQADDGRAGLVASKNITFPSGYTSDNSRRIGGFHYGRWRPLSERYNASFNPPTQIVPTSVWDLGHRPKCDPTGMVEVIPGRLWADIYLNSEDGQSWPNTVPLSRFNATPLTGIEGYSRYLDLPHLLANAGKRLPTLAEFYVYADGAPQGNDSNNDTAWSATSNSGRTQTGAVAKSVSCTGVVDAVGNVWDPCLDMYDVGALTSADYEWDRTIVENGKDASIPRGEIYHVRWRMWIAGGRFDSGERCGARCAHSNNRPENVYATVGLRGVCDSL